MSRHPRVKFSSWLRNEIGFQQQWRCQGCERLLRQFHIDHVTPLAAGGSNSRDNLQALCPECHNSKTISETQSPFFNPLSDRFIDHRVTPRWQRALRCWRRRLARMNK